MVLNISFENYAESIFDERITVRLDLPFVPRVGDIIYLPELILAKLDRMIEDMPRKEADELLEPLEGDQKHYLEDFIYVCDIGLKMDEDFPIWVELSDTNE